MEFISPINSGIGPFYPFVQLPIYLLLSAFIAAAVLAGARALRYPTMASPSHFMAFGAICGLLSLAQLATPWAPDLPTFLLAMGSTLGLAILYLVRVGGRAGA